MTTDQLRAEPILATGPNDRYTRQSRAVQLVRENDGGMRWLHFGAGQALGEDPHAPDPMASYRAGSNGLVRLTFTEGRAIWCDLPALVPDRGSGGQSRAGGPQPQPAAVLDHAILLHEVDSNRPPYQRLLVAGVASDQAKILRWRADSIVLPSGVLLDPDKAQQLGSLLRAAESLFSDIRRLATWMLWPMRCPIARARIRRAKLERCWRPAPSRRLISWRWSARSRRRCVSLERAPEV